MQSSARITCPTLKRTFVRVVIENPFSKNSMEKKVASCVEKHLDTLAKKRAQAIIIDDYGNQIDDKWVKEIEYFFATIVFPILSESEKKSLIKHADYIIRVIIDKKVKRAQTAHNKSLKYNGLMSGSDFEYFCANEINKKGWDARVTRGGGDQGIDIIAEKNDFKLVIQCKKYNNPVGNKAVQEISAGRQHEMADAACVVTNSTFTKSAKELASTNDVHLLHYTQLQDIDRIFQTS